MTKNLNKNDDKNDGLYIQLKTLHIFLWECLQVWDDEELHGL